jgi:hypothetical protein
MAIIVIQAKNISTINACDKFRLDLDIRFSLIPVRKSGPGCRPFEEGR